MKTPHFYWIGAVIAVLGILAFSVLHALPTRAVQEQSPGLELTAVNVATAQRDRVADQVRIEAEFRPYLEDELRVKVSGYLTNITVDIGDRVKKGQLLAELEVPELKNELDHALASQKQAEADHFKAHMAFERLQRVQKEHPNVTLVPQQDIDDADAKDRSTEAAINIAKAEVDKYQTLAAYTKIYAPYDGVITRRYADPGALIQAGTASDTQTMPLVRISDNYRLRLDFPVSVPWVKAIKEDAPVQVEVESLNGRKFTGTIKRFTRRVDEATRKMWTEIEVPNPNLEIVPGMYAAVILDVNEHTNALTIPVQAISSQGRPTVYLVNSSNEIIEQPVILGIETPSKWEVLEGLKEGDRVIIGSRAQLKPGQKVEPKPWIELTAQ
jgi:RND family efflux transporter MFP subunit